jgi:hypothetical protein
MHVIAPTTFVGATLQSSVRDLALRGAGLARPPLGDARPAAVAVVFELRSGHTDAACGGSGCAPRSSGPHLISDERQAHFGASSAAKRAGERPDDIDAADPLTVPVRLFVWCLAAGWTALQMSAEAFHRFLGAWNAASAAIGRAAARAGRAAVAALGPLGDLMRHALAPLGRALLQLWQIAVRPFGPLAARLSARVSAATAWVRRHVAAALARARPLLDRVTATSLRLTRAVSAAVRPITVQAARATAAIRRAATQLRRAVRGKPRHPQ